MNASATKKKKVAEREERRPRIVDVSLLHNEVLRPWIIDINAEKKMKNEVDKLEKTITITTPQKWGGFPGSSSLEIKPQGFEKLRRLVHKQLIMKEMEEGADYILTPSTNEPTSRLGTASGRGSGKQSNSTRYSTSRYSNRMMLSGSRVMVDDSNRDSSADSSRRGIGSGGQHASGPVSITDMYGEDTEIEKVDPNDVEYINKVHRDMYLETLRNRRRATHLSPMHAIKYEKPYEIKTQSVKAVHGVNLKKHNPVSLRSRLPTGPHASLHATS